MQRFLAVHAFAAGALLTAATAACGTSDPADDGYGPLVVATPVADSLAYRVFGRRWVQLDIPRHLYTFTTATLRRYADKAGLRVTHGRHTSRPFQFIGSLLYLANDLTGRRRYLAQSRFHNNPLLVAATIPLTLVTNALGVADQAEVFMTK